ncbi:LLM class flavin-dependent oxidoreductase [Bradyrhizobium sp. LVM 105]|uniref:LLM class flavin-dependent oxidoreductase n=1 Tax=Bradyrhizobium sp. LVM 105 TaxID=2341115 RepID=UPI000F806D7B|nr:LLM class flavin-dependent oxidoreductase [Bradyrhizobium sp. LVM 105]RTE91289.1 LLM class flavin-dependent oxidoreductase [Bradyrhizobium sp. LVM 105]
MMTGTEFPGAEGGSVRKPKCWDGSMRFGIFWPGTRTKLPSARIAELNPDPLNLENHLSLARACEDVSLDLVLLGDGYAPSSEEGTRIGFQDPGLHALVLAAPIILATRHLGVISTLHTTFFHPAHIARFAANMDWMSGGRWGWNIVNGYRDYEASLFGFETLPDSAALYDAAAEAIAVMESLWDASSRTAYAGRHYRSNGKMKGPYPPERPVFVCAAASDRGRKFTATYCDYLFASPTELSALPDIKRDVVRHACEAGRQAPEILVVVDLHIRDQQGEAKLMFDDLMASMETNEAGRKWSGQIGRLRNEQKNPFKFPAFVGTPEEVAEQIIAAHKQWGLNGVLFRPLICSAGEVRRLAPVMQILERAGVRKNPKARNYSW